MSEITLGRTPAGSPFGRTVGELVTVVGIQTRTKVPTVAGIEVGGDYTPSDRRVRATGALRRVVVEPPSPNEPIAATRGPGTYYHLEDLRTGQLAKSVLEE
jgi:hypothetical protein